MSFWYLPSRNAGCWNRIHIYFSLVLCHTLQQNLTSILGALITMLENREIRGRNCSICLCLYQFKISPCNTGIMKCIVLVFTDTDKEPVAIGKWWVFFITLNISLYLAFFFFFFFKSCITLLHLFPTLVSCILHSFPLRLSSFLYIDEGLLMFFNV